MASPSSTVSSHSRAGIVRASVPLSTWIAVAAFCTLWVAFGSVVVPGARRHDFLNLYTGAALARDGNFADLHLPAEQLDRERNYVPDLPELVPFVRPSFYAFLLAPLALLPFTTAFWAWLGLQAGILASVCFWMQRQWGGDALILASMFLPTALGIAHGQDCALMLGIVTGAYILARRDRNFWAGAVLGLGLIKFHLFLLWPVVLILNRQWQLMAGAALSVTAELAISWILGGTTGFRNYFELLRMKDLSRLNPSPELMINVHSLPLHIGLSGTWGLSVLAALVMLVLILATLACRRAPLWRWMAVAAVGSLLIAPHVYGYDAALLLLPLMTAIYSPDSPGHVRFAAIVLLTPLPFMTAVWGSPWSAATSLAMLLFLGTLAFRGRDARTIPTASEAPA